MSSKDIITLVESQQKQIAQALPAGVSADRVVRLVRTVVSTNATIQKCSPRSVLGAAIECAQLGLEPGVTAHLVPYWDNKSKSYRAQMIADYRGLMQLARRSGLISTIIADVVREGDVFDYERGSAPTLKHKPMLGNTGEVLAAYAVARYVSGESQFEIVSRAELDKVAEQSLGKIRNERAREYSPWTTNEAAMQKKTAVRRLCKFLPTSTEDAGLQRAIVLDEAADRGEQNLGATLDAEWEELDQRPAPEVMGEQEREQLAKAINDARPGT